MTEHIAGFIFFTTGCAWNGYAHYRDFLLQNLRITYSLLNTSAGFLLATRNPCATTRLNAIALMMLMSEKIWLRVMTRLAVLKQLISCTKLRLWVQRLRGVTIFYIYEVQATSCKSCTRANCINYIVKKTNHEI